jgi:iron-sulfur cluster insertion protein
MNNPNSAPLINFTLAAASKVKSLIDEEGNPNLNLRVFITGGGCSGFQYGFTFDENINADDIVIEKKLTAKEDEEDGGESGTGGANGNTCSIKPLSNAEDVVIKKNLTAQDDDEDGGESGAGGANSNMCSVKLLVDAMSFQYLQNAEIDYSEDVSGARFIIRNPHAKTTCGCGSSFSV